MTSHFTQVNMSLFKMVKLKEDKKEKEKEKKRRRRTRKRKRRRRRTGHCDVPFQTGQYILVEDG